MMNGVIVCFNINTFFKKKNLRLLFKFFFLEKVREFIFDIQTLVLFSPPASFLGVSGRYSRSENKKYHLVKFEGIEFCICGESVGRPGEY